MPKKQFTLEQYKKDVSKLINSAKDIDYKRKEEIFSECFNLLKREETSSSVQCKSTKIRKFFIKFSIILFLIFVLAIFIYILLNVHQPTSSLVLRNVQNFIYPGLKFFRVISVPFIEKFPFLTGLYDESCLVENPYFFVDEMECWPCFDVFSVIQLRTPQNQTIYMSGKPHITTTNHKSVSMEELKSLYNRNKYLFHEEFSIMKSSSDQIKNLDELFSESIEKLKVSDLHVSWRINRMSLARIVRSIFPRAETLPERSGQSVERYIIIDGAKSPPYKLPNMECSYIGVRQAKGRRTIVLKPSPECSRECRTVSVILNTTTILWYNWWYWRPVSLPVANSTDLAISYISSYC